MPRKTPLDFAAVDMKVAILEARRNQGAPLWEAALASGDWSQMSDAKALDKVLRAAELICKRMAGRASAPCADGIFEPGHGRAA